MTALTKLLVYYSALLAAYAFLVSVAPGSTRGLTILFTSLLLIPASAQEIYDLVRRHRGGA